MVTPKLKITKEHIENKWRMKLLNAKDRGISLLLTKEEFFYVWENALNVCDLSGKRMTAENGRPDTATLDRIRPEGDYHISNICIVRQDVNHAKSMFIETKIDAPKRPTIKDKKLLAQINSTLCDPVKLKKVKEKYVMPSKEVGSVSETNVEAPSEDFKVNEDVYLSGKYSALGSLVGGISDFDLTYNQFKLKMKTKSCGLTKRKFTNEDDLVLYWVDKTKSFSKDNTIITTKVLQEALDVFSAKTKLSLTDLRNVVKVLASIQ